MGNKSGQYYIMQVITEALSTLGVKILEILTFIILTLTILLCIQPHIAHATTSGKASCKPSKAMSDNYEPEKFTRTNNLLKSAGESASSCSAKLVIKGKLVDKNCVPISDAKVYIWQADCNGKYNYALLKNVPGKEGAMNKVKKPGFLGSGSTTTDNKGEFYFITQMPISNNGKYNHSKGGPYISLRVTHPYFDDLDTRLYVSEGVDTVDQDDFSTPEYNEFEGYITKEFQIVLPGSHPLREF